MTQPAPTSRVDSRAILQALAEDNRSQILRLLVDRQLAVKDLVAATGLSQPLVSHHLKVLREAGLVDAATLGSRTVHRARPEALVEMAERLLGLAARAQAADAS